MTISEDEFEAKARSMAPNPPAPAATPVSESVKFGEREGRCDRCERGLQQVQLRDGGAWVPARCEACRQPAETAKAEAAASARAAVASGQLNVPKRYVPVTLENFRLHGERGDRDDQARILQLARRYAADWPEVAELIVFRGGFGTGKGHISWSLAKLIAEAYGADVRVVKLPDLIRDLRETWRRDAPDTESQRLMRYRRADLLVVDEVSRHAFYGESFRHLYDVVDYRVEQMRPTILTTNEDHQGLAEVLGPALTSRAAGSSGLWEFGERDFRVNEFRAA